MFTGKAALAVVLPLFASHALGQSALQLDVDNQDSIKSAAKSLAGGLIAAYHEELKDNRIPGQFGSKTYFWEWGTIWDAIAQYSHLTGDSQYDQTFSEALQFQLGDYDAFMPPNQTKTLGNDDQSSWGLAAMTAAEVGLAKPKDGQWVDYAVNVWNTQNWRLEAEEGPNGTCGGGLRWQIFTFNNGFEYKNSVSNGNFLLLSARLAKFTGNATYLQAADRVFKWSQDVGLISGKFDVFDGTSANGNCSTINRIQWTNNLGVFAEGAAVMSNLTQAQNYTDAIKGFVNASTIFTTYSNNSKIISEVACERNGKCNLDQRAFKGIFARTMARAALASPSNADAISTLLKVNAKAAANACTNDDEPKCALRWTVGLKDFYSSAADGNIGEVFAALEAVQGLLGPSAKALNTGNGSTTGNSTGPSGASGSGAPQATGAAASVASSMMAVFAVAFAAALSL